MSRILPALAAFLLFAAACGGETGGTSTDTANSVSESVAESQRESGKPPPTRTPTADAPAGDRSNASVEGAWVVDRVERAGKVDPELAKGKLLLELKADGTFVQTMDVATIAGTWALRGATLTLVTKSVDGEDMAPDTSAEEQTDTLTLKDGLLVMSEGDVRFLLRRR